VRDAERHDRLATALELNTRPSRDIVRPLHEIAEVSPKPTPNETNELVGLVTLHDLLDQLLPEHGLTLDPEGPDCEPRGQRRAEPGRGVRYRLAHRRPVAVAHRQRRRPG
jgi:CBS domain containing-hemolysin-like protein